MGAYAAKTQLSRLLREVGAGETIAITKHGVTVALLVPPADRSRPAPADVIAALKRASEGATLGELSLSELIEEGRRF